MWLCVEVVRGQLVARSSPARRGGSMLTVERIKSIQASLHAEDVEVDWVVMLSWSEADVRAYFERGGQAAAPALPSRQEWRKALDGDGDDCAAPSDISDAHAAASSTTAAPSSEPPAPPQPKRFMRPSDFTNSPAPTQAERREGYLPGVHAPRSAADDAREDAEKQRGHEPPPTLPGGSGVMSVEEAYDFLGVASEDRGNLEKVKARFRKMCLRWHPDKNRGRERQAAEVFQAATAAYHFLTTRNFDYKRWKASFTIPPMQSLDEVLMMALSGEDPYRIEELLRRRGEYRPHRDFGVNLSMCACLLPTPRDSRHPYARPLTGWLAYPYAACGLLALRAQPVERWPLRRSFL